MKILVTGGAGFIGSHTVDLLIENGFDVRILDNLEGQVHQGKKPEYLNPKAEFILGDITNSHVLKKSLKGIDVIIHLAAITGIGQSMYEPSRYLSANIVGTAGLYDVLIGNPEIKRNIQKIIVASSKTVYGEGSYECKTHGVVYPELRSEEQMRNRDWEIRCPICKEQVRPVKIKEEKPAQNLSVYALSKFATEALSLMYGNILGIPTIVFRYFSGYGPRQSLNNPYTGVCSIFLCRMRNKKPPIIYEDGKQVRDFIFVKDIARANLLASKKAEKIGVYNIGTGVPTSMIEIAKMLKDILGINIKPIITQEYRIGDTRHDFANISKAERELGFKPKWKLKEGLEELVEWGETKEAIDMFERADAERKTLQQKG
jgi:dTDP-L-rhamnose 4-epimerase